MIVVIVTSMYVFKNVCVSILYVFPKCACLHVCALYITAQCKIQTIHVCIVLTAIDFMTQELYAVKASFKFKSTQFRVLNIPTLATTR